MPEHSFDQILVKMETSLHLVEEMETILKQIAAAPHPAAGLDPRLAPAPVPAGLRPAR
jgi:hypothetical protein